MEAAVVSAATGALQSIPGKLATLFSDEYKRFKGVRTEIKPLICDLKAMQAFLVKMSEVENLDDQDKIWQDEVRELSYDIEDNLDEVLLCVDDKSSNSDGFMKKIKNLLDTAKTRPWIAKAIEDLKKPVDEAEKRRKRYKTDLNDYEATSVNAMIDPRALVVFEDVSKLVGTEEPKNEIIKLLTKDIGSESMQRNMKAVSIVGFGGMGKTTLANQVYQELKGQFDCHVFLSVSRNPDMMKILRTIHSEVNAYGETEAAGITQVIKNILDSLADKRYLIVVDDIWNVEIWDLIKRAFRNNNCGSRIITTTRINDVAQSCRSSTNGHIYNIRPLNMMHSRQLFNNRLFNSEEKYPSHLEEVSGQILEKCAGLPLAIIAISGLLANKASTKDQWEQVKNSIGRGLEKNSSVKGMIEILSLSYFDLPSELKSCLLYLSIFPEDYIIEKEDLIRRWTAEGFIRRRDQYTIQASGEMCFNELINRSLIQPGEKAEMYDEVKSCRVHDTILDFIISKSTEENFVTILGVPGISHNPQNKVRRLSLQNHCEIPTDLVLTNARSLNVFGRPVEIPSLLKFRHLRVLGFEDCSQLEDDHLADIANFFHLRYLKLKHLLVEKLPEEMAKLRYLETLDIHGYDTPTEIPSTICRLPGLVHLIVDRDTVFSDDIGGMQALDVLEVINVYTQSIDFLQKLSELSKLRKLSIRFINSDAPEDCTDYVEEIASSVSELGEANLHSLRIIIDEAADEILEESWCPASLEELVIEGDSVSEVPEWIGSLDKLQKLVLPMCKLGKDDVEMLGELHNLRYLCIRWYEDDWPELKAELESAIEGHANNPTLVWIDQD